MSYESEVRDFERYPQTPDFSSPELQSPAEAMSKASQDFCGRQHRS